MLTLHETCEDEWTVSLKSRAHLLIANIGLSCQTVILPVFCLRLFLYFERTKKEKFLHLKMTAFGRLVCLFVLVCFL